MARRDLRQVSFADGLVNQRAGRNSWMDEIDKLIDWSAVVKSLDRIYGSDEGRPSYPLLTYVKLLLLHKLKHLLRKAQARTDDEVCAAIGQSLRASTPQECANYFKNAGYSRSCRAFSGTTSAVSSRTFDVQVRRPRCSECPPR